MRVIYAAEAGGSSDNSSVYTSEDISSQIDGDTKAFQLTYEYLMGTTRVYQQHIALQRGVSGDPSYGNDYYEIATSGDFGRWINFYLAPSGGEWVQVDYMRSL